MLMKSINQRAVLPTRSMEEHPKIFLHVDMDAFFASVEQRDHPELRGKPVIVGAPPERRGVVAAASYEARKFGVHSAMPSSVAIQKCPQAIFVEHHLANYKEVSRQIMHIFESYTPFVQPLSIDEAFLDVTGARRLFGDGKTIAEKIRADIRNRTQLTASVGVAPNMFLAKIASDMNKPDGLTLVPADPDAIKAFLAPLPIDRMWGVGKVTQKKLLSMGITTFGTLQSFDSRKLQEMIGRRAADTFRRLAMGIDDRSIVTERDEKSISNETTFGEDISDPEYIISIYKKLIENVGRRLRRAELEATTAHLKLRWSDFSTITRQTRFSLPCNDDITLREIGMELLNANLQNRPVRLIGFGVSGLIPAGTSSESQLDLFESRTAEQHDRRSRLSRVTDMLKEKYGIQSLRRGSDLE